MKTIKHTSKKNQYEVGTSIDFSSEPTPTNKTKKLIDRVGDKIKTEAKLFFFDKMHGTHYRDIYHNLAEEAKRQRFEASIGLQRVA